MKTQKSSNPKQLIEMIVLTIKELKFLYYFNEFMKIYE